MPGKYILYGKCQLFAARVLRGFFLAVIVILLVNCTALAQQAGAMVKEIPVAKGWAANSINTVIFRKNSLASFRDTQFISFYDAEGFVVLGKRQVNSLNWQLKKLEFKGNVKDAHNAISIMVDGAGYLHMSWDHHNNPLNYCVSKWSGSLEMTNKLTMTGLHENKVSYPEFYKMANGDLLFFFRDGGSGQGNLVINKYDLAEKKWTQLQRNLVDGEGKRNAYWQACTDDKGTIHLSWVWRESPDVASNHDFAYACSKDGGRSWQKSTGEKYTLPITAATAEYALAIPQNSELINQVSMTADDNGNPFIATYWREPGSLVPQYHVIYNTGRQWKSVSLNNRTSAFSLSGQGSKRIPIARPQISVSGKVARVRVILIFRDEERDNKVSVAMCNHIKKPQWKFKDLINSPVGSWEPTYDIQRWKDKHVLSLFVQQTEQADGEGLSNFPPQMIHVLEWQPGR